VVRVREEESVPFEHPPLLFALEVAPEALRDVMLKRM
jgi:hypothetical protein